MSERSKLSSRRTKSDPEQRLATEIIESAVFREFIADLSAAGTLMRRLRRTLASVASMNAAEYAVLLGVWYCERAEKTSVREIADHLHIAAPHVTTELGKLERAGFVVKRDGVNDRRTAEIRLSPKGKRLFDVLAGAFREVNLVLFDDVTVGDVRIVHEFFRRIISQAPDAIRVAEIHASRAERSRERTGAKPAQKAERRSYILDR